MNRQSFHKAKTNISSLVEVVPSTLDDEIGAYRLGGYFSGPSVMLLGHDTAADLVFDRLLCLPTLAWMRGKMTLVFVDRLSTNGWKDIVQHEHIDRTFILPFLLNKDTCNVQYWRILRACAKLGMINGRGVKLR